MAHQEETVEEVRASRDRLAMAIEGARIGTWDWDVVSNRFVYSERWAAMTGYAPDELPQKHSSWKERVHPEDVGIVRAAVLSHLSGLVPAFRVEHRMRCKDGSYLWVLASGRVVGRDAQDKAVRISGITMDISVEKELSGVLEEREQQLQKVVEHLRDLNDQLVFAADHDGLTELLNHRAFRREAAFRLQSRRQGEQAGLLLMDLDHFKRINDQHGHVVGDDVLREFAMLLRQALPPTTLIGRLGGEEFGVFLTGSDEVGVSSAGRRIVESTRTWPWPIARVRCSIGAALAGREATVDGLLASADRNLYIAKNNGRDQMWLDRAA
ncbi:MAG: hypothetical protein AMXMBFR81_22410 [Chthonomonas sp.]